MKALSIRQPWAWLICKGYKDIENRNWHIHMPPLLNYPATPRRIYVHAGLSKAGWDKHFKGKALEEYQFIKARLPDVHFPVDVYYGGIIGEVDITGCVDKSDSPWFVGPYGFTLANPVLYDNPIPCRGMLGFFEPGIEVKE